MNFREKFIEANLKTCEELKDFLTDWERDEFLPRFREQHIDEYGNEDYSRVSTADYNKLHEIAEALKLRILFRERI
jgi:hypothetical protein